MSEKAHGIMFHHFHDGKNMRGGRAQFLLSNLISYLTITKGNIISYQQKSF